MPQTTAFSSRIAALLLLIAVCLAAAAQPEGADTRCLQLMGVPLEGQADSVATDLTAIGFTAWGESETGENRHFRGDYYGFRSKLMVTADTESGMVSSALVTIGPYRTKEMLNHNAAYFAEKLRQSYGELTEINGSLITANDYGMVKLSTESNATGAWEVKVFYFVTAPFYKDALSMGLKGRVMEVVTTNPVGEEPVMHFSREGKTEQHDIWDRTYSRYGYMLSAMQQESDGENSTISMKYDRLFRLTRRTVENKTKGIRSVHDFQYGDNNMIARQTQRVYNSKGECIIAITLTNNYDDYDDEGNWTTNKLSLTYWEKDGPSQQGTIQQTRTISYWEE